MPSPSQYRAFLAALEKAGGARTMMEVAQSRVGRRPIRVDTLLKRDENGTLLKKLSSVNTQPKTQLLKGNTKIDGSAAGRRPLSDPRHPWEYTLEESRANHAVIESPPAIPYDSVNYNFPPGGVPS